MPPFLYSQPALSVIRLSQCISVYSANLGNLKQRLVDGSARLRSICFSPNIAVKDQKKNNDVTTKILKKIILAFGIHGAYIYYMKHIIGYFVGCAYFGKFLQ